MVPISVAIVLDHKPLVYKLLCSKSYEVMKPDKYKRTPFIYVCQKNQIDWMEKIFSRININNANIVDCSCKSALTYDAENNNIKFCNFLFLNNIEVFGMSCDSNKIISSYRELLNKFEEFKKSAENNYNQAKNDYDKYDHEVWYIGTEISSLRSEISSLSMSPENDYYGMERSSKESSLFSAKFRLNLAEERRDKAEKAMNKYKERFDEIIKMTRKDLLINFKYVVKLAMDEDDISYMENSFSSKFFDPDSFIQAHPIMKIGSY